MFAIRTILRSILLIALALPALGSPTPQRFRLTGVSVQPGQTWALNREVVFSFNEALDFSSVSLSTVRLTTVGGDQVQGNFILRNPAEMVFQPSCPVQPDFSDGGFVPGEVYVLYVPDATNSASMLLAQSGKQLAEGALVSFQTPNSTVPSVLFDDEASGPPVVLTQPGHADGSWLWTGAGDELFFQQSGGVATLPGFLAPANLYSDLASRVTVFVRLNQTLSPLESNINSGRIRLEYQDLAGAWHQLVSEVTLVQNCGGVGATLAVTAAGVFPQDRLLRVWIGAGLQDIVGEATVVDLDHLQFMTGSFTDGAGNAIEHSDEWFEGFDGDSNSGAAPEDIDLDQNAVPAIWGNGKLRASTGLEGDGGPGGDFDFRVPPGVVVIIDTISDTIYGGPNGIPTASQLVVGGVLHVRDLIVPETSMLIFSGPNPATIFAAGEVTIDGAIRADGLDATQVFTLNTPYLPEFGGRGNCGGGNGGTGSYLTNQVTPRGGHGSGAFGVDLGGGEGGEGGWSATSSANNRRAAGGGGGRFGHDQSPPGLMLGACADQSIYGLDAESGFVGGANALSTIDTTRIPPWGGHAGSSPFVSTATVRDDFYGQALLDFRTATPSLTTGELNQPWAGAGGGAGGDATKAPNGYPPASLVNGNSDKGAGGGGGGGAISIYALGDVTFGPQGRLTAIGGHGSGGENTGGTNRIGGGSGGGSGGHIIVQTIGRIDLSQVPAGSVAIDARGGQGGAGENNTGGADESESSDVRKDAKHDGGPDDNPWIAPLPQQCLNYDSGLETNQTYIVRAAGGDGGPGVVQLHVAHLAGDGTPHDILYPLSGLQHELASSVRPLPVGFDVNRLEWRDHLLPTISRVSQGQSKWIALGQPQVAPGTSAPDWLSFHFEGTHPATGMVETAQWGMIPSGPPILAPSALVGAPGLPSVASSTLIYFDPAGFSPADQRYRKNPALLRGFELRFDNQGGTYVKHTISSAEIVDRNSIQVLAVTVENGWWNIPSTAGLVASVRPRSFRIHTGFGLDSMPLDASIRIEFQAAGADSEGQPDPAAIFPSDGTWVTDLSTFAAPATNAAIRFMRFRVTFELGTLPDLLEQDLPAFDFLKLPFSF